MPWAMATTFGRFPLLAPNLLAANRFLLLPKKFTRGSQPLFGTRARGWNLEDARDFSEADRTVFAAFYDTLLAHTDEQVGRLITALRTEDPALRSILVAVMADHGEQLGEEGRTGHSATLAEGVQHVPFILAGATIPPAQKFGAFSENIDIAPTIASLRRPLRRRFSSAMG